MTAQLRQRRKAEIALELATESQLSASSESFPELPARGLRGAFFNSNGKNSKRRSKNAKRVICSQMKTTAQASLGLLIPLRAFRTDSCSWPATRAGHRIPQKRLRRQPWSCRGRLGDRVSPCICARKGPTRELWRCYRETSAKRTDSLNQ
jgi:hypothetical protein